MVQKAWGIIIACGKSEQLDGGADIAFLGLGDRPVLALSMAAFERSPEIDGLVVVPCRDKVDTVAGMVRLFGSTKVRKVVGGTSLRLSSLLAGLKAVDGSVGVVCVHDVSRPCVTSALITETVRAARRYGAGVAASPVTDAIKVVDKSQRVLQSLEPARLRAAQTPQAFKRDVLEKALAEAVRRKVVVEDVSAVLALVKQSVHLVPAPATNLRIRTVDDLVVAGSILRIA